MDVSEDQPLQAAAAGPSSEGIVSSRQFPGQTPPRNARHSPYDKMTSAKRAEAKKSAENWRQTRHKYSPGQKNSAVTEVLNSGSEDNIEVREVSEVGT